MARSIAMVSVARNLCFARRSLLLGSRILACLGRIRGSSASIMLGTKSMRTLVLFGTHCSRLPTSSSACTVNPSRIDSPLQGTADPSEGGVLVGLPPVMTCVSRNLCAGPTLRSTRRKLRQKQSTLDVDGNGVVSLVSCCNVVVGGVSVLLA
jgi:hypothetical protein